MGQALLLEDRGGYKASVPALTARTDPFTQLGGAFNLTLASQKQSIMTAVPVRNRTSAACGGITRAANSGWW